MEKTLTPIEQAFLDAAATRIEDLKSQEWISHYRVDFLIENKRLVIELDGHAFHSTREQRTSDASRQRELQQLGYAVIRFTGSEIYADVEACVNRTLEMLDRLPEQNISVPASEKVRYCIRMKEVATALLEKFGQSPDKHFYLHLCLEFHDDLYIMREDKTVAVGHFYEPKEDVRLSDPCAVFQVVKRGGENYSA